MDDVERETRKKRSKISGRLLMYNKMAGVFLLEHSTRLDSFLSQSDLKFPVESERAR